jgi:hypothetical protein
MRLSGALWSVAAVSVAATAASPSARMPRATFVTQTPRGVAAVTLGGRVTNVLRGYSLFRPRGLNVQMFDVAPVYVRAGGRTFAFDPARRRFVPSAEREVVLPRGTRLHQERAKVWLTVGGKSDLTPLASSDVFISERRDVLTLPGATAARGYVIRRAINRRLPKTCRVATTAGATWYLLCGSISGNAQSRVEVLTATGRVRALVPPATRYGPRPDGWWVSVFLSPDAKTLLLQWSGECESPSAWYAPASGGRPRPVAGDAAVESFALGWAPDGRAVVQFPQGMCGSGIHRPGIYLVDVHTGRKTYVRRAGVYLP